MIAPAGLSGPSRAGRRAPAPGLCALAALAPALLLGLDPGGWHPFGPAKWLVLVVLGGIGSLLVLRARRPLLPRPVARASGLLLAWLAVAAAVGEDPWFAWVGTPERRFGWVTWALCVALLLAGSALPAARPVLAGLSVAGLGLGGLATVEALGWEPAAFAVSGRLSATLGSAAYLGAASALLLPVATGVALDGSMGRGWRKIAAVAVPLLVVASVGAGARAAWLGLAAAASTVAWARRHHLRGRPLVVAGGAALGGLVLGLLLLLTPAGSRLTGLLDDGAPGGQGRLDEWRVAIATARDHLLVGVGPEGYRTVFHEGVDPDYERAHGRAEQPDRAHSAPLDVLLVGGLPALGLWGAVVVGVGRRLRPALRAGPPWQAGVAAGVVAHLVGQLALFPLAEVEPIAWLLAGTVVAGTPLDAAPAPPSAATPRFPRWLGAGVAVLVGVLVVGAAAGVLADRSAAAASRAMARGDGPAAVDEASRAIALRPDWPRQRLLAASAAVLDDRGLHTALAEVRAGLAWSPGDPILRRAEIALLVDRSLATGAAPHRHEAEAAIADRLRVDPHDASTWERAARLADGFGDPDRAAEAWRRWRALVPPERRGR